MEPTDEGAPPAVTARTRTYIYVGCLILNVLAVLIFGLGVVFELLDAQKALEAGAIVVAAISLISNGLAVGYRPTRPGTDGR
jgi:hypothetical protein